MANIKDAYARFHEEDAALQRYRRALKRIERDIVLLEDGLLTQVAEELATTRAGRKALHAFTGRTLYGWDMACGSDGRLKKLARSVGWDRFKDAISLARRMEEW